MSFNPSDSVPNVLSIDFESWVHTYPFRGMDSIRRKRLDDGFVFRAGMKLLEILNRHKVTATFFIVSEISKWYPELIEEIEMQGHEIALHSHTHRILCSKSVLVDEMNQSADFIRRFNVRGFRAPRLYFKQEYMEVLSRFEIVYDSSTYGSWKAINHVNGVAEIPISAWVYSYSNRNRSYFGPLNWKALREFFPFGSPYVMGLFRRFVLNCIQLENKAKRPTIVCIHLWQIIHPDDFYKFMLQFLSHDILSLPYCIKCQRVVEELLKAVKIITMRQFSDNYFWNINRNEKT